MIEKIRKHVIQVCRSEKNFYGFSAWTHHISSVNKYGKILAKKLKADVEIVEIATLLHDIASVSKKEWYPEHHIHGARIAEELLKQYKYPIDRIEKIKHCIMSHRGSRSISKRSVEAKIVADADSMSHFDNVDSLMHLGYGVHKMGVDEGRQFVLDKLKRSWEKLSPDAKKIIEKKYHLILEVFDKKSLV